MLVYLNGWQPETVGIFAKISKEKTFYRKSDLWYQIY